MRKVVPIENAPVFPEPFLLYAIKSQIFLSTSPIIRGIATDWIFEGLRNPSSSVIPFFKSAGIFNSSSSHDLD
jgi:hypothetical protein